MKNKKSLLANKYISDGCKYLALNENRANSEMILPCKKRA
jgi:hypothetical protein